MPVPMSFTDAYVEAIMYANGAVTHYDCLTITSSVDTNIIRLVNSFETLSTPQGDYLACPFDITPPDTEGETVGALEISVKFLPKAARVWLAEQSTSLANLSISWLQYIGEGIGPDFECRVPFSVTKVDRLAGGGAKLTATLPDLVNIPLCRTLMTKDLLPGMAI